MLGLILSEPVMALDGNYRNGDRLNPQAKLDASGFRETEWAELMPKLWNTSNEFSNLDLNAMDDGDTRAQEALMRMREIWANAPVEPSLNGARIRIAGFLVPLEESDREIREFLLIPYFGGCIHVPPPPANQIIHVMLKKALKGMKSMDAIWISGVLETQHFDSDIGSASYHMEAGKVEPDGEH